MKETQAITEIASSAAHKEIKNDPRYKKIQEEIAQKHQQQQQIQQSIKPLDTSDKVELTKSLFDWKKNKEGDYEIKAQERLGTGIKAGELKYSASKILNILGYKIDISSRVDSLKEEYLRTYIETKSPNLIMAKFYYAKLNILNVMLSVLGISSEELQKLQKQALKKAIAENEDLFEQNEYNTEMFFLFGAGKKDKSKQKIFDETKRQLTEQMNFLGNKEFYTPEKVTTIKVKVVDKIKEDLNQEEQNLLYMKDIQL